MEWATALRINCVTNVLCDECGGEWEAEIEIYID